MGLTTPAIIVIVIVACLAAVSLGAALTRQLNPAESYESRFQPSHAQEMYMRSVRMRTLGTFRRESLFSAASRGMGRDLESRSNGNGFRSPRQFRLLGTQTDPLGIPPLIGFLAHVCPLRTRSAHASANARDSRRQGELDGSSFRTVVGFLFSLEVYKLAVPLSAG
ncbi:hypothetical protein KXV89_001548 [Aspergillus fumigatus]|nr:hypothetical protein KXX22_001004 [Aspergillus fumigatus]KAH1642678.1 hypothetical protein KXX59_000431 [Aspergillus fumigatus]KAH2941377.1 hypothetical protein KXW45_000747 [Aspergillus fumigatus]KAH3019767.1 hypothetical protein KXV89_001548 [Aspergillus fumigatus]KAH3170280.1 hypothetical protein KXW49_000751 [Aspergillus fumigatus]